MTRGGWSEAEARRIELLELLSEGLTVDEACKTLEISPVTYRAWRKRYPEYAAEADSRLNGFLRYTDEEGHPTWEGFVEFRLAYFGHSTPYHQQRIIQAIEDTQPGDVTMVLVPPEHGKTTIFEDWACYKLAMDPEWRIMVGCEAQTLSKRILDRVKRRMATDGPFPKFVKQFGPFAPHRNSGSDQRQIWAADHFNVFKRRDFDERDYSMSALGYGSNVIGSRTDHLHLDDIQSKKTLNQTEQMFETIQQDWLTRPGETGITTFNGTRAGDGDIYEAAMTQWEGQPWFRVVKLPAIVTDQITGEQRPLWPYDPTTKGKNKGYTMDALAKIRAKMGEEVWSRSYMQNPRASGLGTWEVEHIERCYNYDRTIFGPLPSEYAPIYIGLDPALGGINCLMAWQITSEKMYLVDVLKAVNLKRNEDIMLQLEMMLNRLKARGGRVTEVIIEAMNFQRGLSRDERLEEMAQRWGFVKREHMTGWNKYNEDIGVASMPTSFIQREIDLPYAAEDKTREATHRFRDELLRWRPGIKGSLLRQDEVMATWFVWIKWQERRKSEIENSNNAFKADGMKWKPTQTGFLVPSGASPFYGA